MTISVGVGFAFVAMLCWGIGDFLIQKSTRRIGDFETLFLITFFGAALLLPFVYQDIPDLFEADGKNSLPVLVGGSLILFLAAVLNFEALRRGKISVVEPIWSFEIVAASLFAFFVLGERLSVEEIALVILLMLGLFLVSFRGKILSHRHFLERGVSLAFLGAVAMGIANFFVGWGARLTDALVVNFVFNVVIAILSGVYLLVHGRLFQSFRDLMRYRVSVIPMIITDNAAWIAYAFAMSLIPIGIATALSESYIIIAVILGFALGREKLGLHQKVGLIVALITAITLATISA
ncbi:MAG: hypothetical protein A2849_02605 [Candidatus Taylorbacteria bacterium RIFCSPHIGHO2_01_FULL_51_15]|uniref:EamA domain-containing protein n=1 Tax=Candidatus Taylorbacteria bacterium RIFCSPHIGHO2_01_FULL_51_15 TaxID=1802304 RepID=A0A1G2MF60_9BACT|nr:MAG: hypothetical protein A2849_02605 [Candidatus Taylorbacteria bacterium RIFCSPHIGHO2_01_FULL_51_15]